MAAHLALANKLAESQTLLTNALLEIQQGLDDERVWTDDHDTRLVRAVALDTDLVSNSYMYVVEHANAETLACILMYNLAVVHQLQDHFDQAFQLYEYCQALATVDLEPISQAASCNTWDINLRSVQQLSSAPAA